MISGVGRYIYMKDLTFIGANREKPAVLDFLEQFGESESRRTLEFLLSDVQGQFGDVQLASFVSMPWTMKEDFSFMHPGELIVVAYPKGDNVKYGLAKQTIYSDAHLDKSPLIIAGFKPPIFIDPSNKSWSISVPPNRRRQVHAPNVIIGAILLKNDPEQSEEEYMIIKPHIDFLRKAYGPGKVTL